MARAAVLILGLVLLVVVVPVFGRSVGPGRAPRPVKPQPHAGGTPPRDEADKSQPTTLAEQQKRLTAARRATLDEADQIFNNPQQSEATGWNKYEESVQRTAMEQARFEMMLQREEMNRQHQLVMENGKRWREFHGNVRGMLEWRARLAEDEGMMTKIIEDAPLLVDGIVELLGAAEKKVVEWKKASDEAAAAAAEAEAAAAAEAEKRRRQWRKMWDDVMIIASNAEHTLSRMEDRAKEIFKEQKKKPDEYESEISKLQNHPSRLGPPPRMTVQLPTQDSGAGGSGATAPRPRTTGPDPVRETVKKLDATAATALAGYEETYDKAKRAHDGIRTTAVAEVPTFKGAGRTALPKHLKSAGPKLTPIRRR